MQLAIWHLLSMSFIVLNYSLCIMLSYTHCHIKHTNLVLSHPNIVHTSHTHTHIHIHTHMHHTHVHKCIINIHPPIHALTYTQTHTSHICTYVTRFAKTLHLHTRWQRTVFIVNGQLHQ